MILLTGGSGLLGRELRKHLSCYAPSHQEFDVTKPVSIPDEVNLIIHCAAYTDVLKAQSEPWKCMDVNDFGTENVARLGKPLVYISTEYVFDGIQGNYLEGDKPAPVNVYGLSKLRGEESARKAPRWLIVRTLFKPRPYKHAQAPVDQMTSGDYVDVIAPEIVKAVEFFATGRFSGIIHIGTEKKTTYELASRTRDVQKIKLEDIPMTLPRDTSLDTRKWENMKAVMTAALYGY